MMRRDPDRYAADSRAHRRRGRQKRALAKACFADDPERPANATGHGSRAPSAGCGTCRRKQPWQSPMSRCNRADAHGNFDWRSQHLPVCVLVRSGSLAQDRAPSTSPSCALVLADCLDSGAVNPFERPPPPRTGRSSRSWAHRTIVYSLSTDPGDHLGLGPLIRPDTLSSVPYSVSSCGQADELHGWQSQSRPPRNRQRPVGSCRHGPQRLAAFS